VGSLVPHLLNVTISNSAYSFGALSSADTMVIRGMRIMLDFQFDGDLSQGHGEVKIFGLSEAKMEALTFLNWDGAGLDANTITVEAGTSDADMKTIIKSDILQAMPDYSGAPNVPLVIVCKMGLMARLKPAQSVSFPGLVSAQTILEKLAGMGGYSLEYQSAVTSSLTDASFSGSMLDMIEAAKRALRITYHLDTIKNVLAVWDPLKGRSIPQIDVSAGSGLIGWPRLTRLGVDFDMLFNPSVQFGGPILLKSQVQRANGVFYVSGLTHQLESNLPGGAWFTTVRANKNAGTVVLAGG
jgi:hypothetical protein